MYKNPKKSVNFLIISSFKEKVNDRFKDIGLRNIFKNFWVNFIYTSEIWTNTNQVQDFSKLTNLVPKASLVPKTVEKK